MKKFIIVPVFALLLFWSNDTSAQVFNERNFGIDTYYGTPTLFQGVFKVFIKKIIDTIPNSDLNYSRSGPIGIRGEFMVSNMIGVGLDVAYNSFTLTNNRKDSLFNTSDNSNQEVKYQDVFSTSKLGIMLTGNVHLLKNPKFDLALVGGLGFGIRTFGIESNDPAFEKGAYKYNKRIFPLSAKIGIETRYFFTENIGLNAGLGVGQGGILHGGISFKF